MQVGSLVVCVQSISGAGFYKGEAYQFAPPVNKGEAIYTVDDMTEGFGVNCTPDKKYMGITLAEIPKGYHPVTNETMYYSVEHFKEVQPPLDLTKILENEEVKELADV